MMKLIITRDEILLKGKTHEDAPTTTFEFGDVPQALRYAEENAIEIEEDATFIGNKLGEFAVALSEGDMNEQQVIDALLYSTDDVWHDSVKALGELLLKAAEKM